MDKSIVLESENLIDVWKEVGLISEDVNSFVEFQDKASELQIESLKAKAIKSLLDILWSAEDENTRVQASKALLQHFRSEKTRLERKQGKIKEEDLLKGEPLFGPWRKREGTD